MKKSNRISKLLRYSLFLFVTAFTIMCMTTSPTQAKQCASFNFLTNTLHVPCFNAGTTSFWIDIGLVNSNPITLEIKNFGDNGSLGNVSKCASFDFFTSNFHIPCFDLTGTSFWLDLSLVSSYPTFLLQLVDFGEVTTTDCVNVSGTWSITDDVDARNCGEGKYTDYYTYFITQTGCDFNVTKPEGTFSGGEINGNELTWSGKYDEEGRETSIEMNATISGDGNSLTGSSEWTWSDGFFSCSGTSEIKGTRL